MYIDRWVYNTLSRFARRIKMNRSVVTASFSGVAMLFGLTVMLFDEPHKLYGATIVLLGLLASLWSNKQVLADDRKELERQRKEMRHAERMVSGIETMNKNIGDLVNEIRVDKAERK